MAMEDAVILAKCLRDMSDVPNAFSAYERLRCKRIERIVAEGSRQPVGRALRDALLPLAFRFLATEKSQSRLYDHHIAWDVSVATPQRTSSRLGC